MSHEDAARLEFLKRLDQSTALEVSDWEAGFIENFLDNPRSMTPAQRAAVDGMREKYEAKL